MIEREDISRLSDDQGRQKAAALQSLRDWMAQERSKGRPEAAIREVIKQEAETP